MQSQVKHIDSITTLRAVAALLVCLIHLSGLTGYHTTGVFQSIINEGQNGVGIFFVISGFILPYSLFKKDYQLKDFNWFLLRRIVRIDPPYWASIIIVFICGAQAISAITFKSILLHLTYLVPFIKNAGWYSDVYWTLSIEFQFYIIIGLTYPLLMKLPAKIAVIAAIIPAVICIIMGANYRGIIITNLYCFTMGFILFMWFIKKIDTIFFAAALILFVGFVMAFVSIKSGMLPLMTAAFVVFYRNKFSLKPVLYIGNISYSLYLLHLPVSYLLVKILSGHIGKPSYLFIATLMVSILISSIFYLLIEKPSIKFSKNLKAL